MMVLTLVGQCIFSGGEAALIVGAYECTVPEHVAAQIGFKLGDPLSCPLRMRL